MVIAVPTLMQIVATPLITHQADRHRALKATLVIGSVVGAARHDRGRAGGWAGRDSAAFTVAMVALSPMLSLSDAYALSGLGARGRSYGPVRLWGSVAFIAGNVGAGLILEAIAPGHLIWLIVSALVLSVAAAARWRRSRSVPGRSRRLRRASRRRFCCATRRFSPSCWRRA